MPPAERVVVDTNIFVSRLLRFDSVPGRAAEKAIHQAVLLVSQPTMSELADVLAQAKFDRYVTIEQRLQFIRSLPIPHNLFPSFILSANAATRRMTSFWKWR